MAGSIARGHTARRRGLVPLAAAVVALVAGVATIALGGRGRTFMSQGAPRRATLVPQAASRCSTFSASPRAARPLAASSPPGGAGDAWLRPLAAAGAALLLALAPAAAEARGFGGGRLMKLAVKSARTAVIYQQYERTLKPTPAYAAEDPRAQRPARGEVGKPASMQAPRSP